MSGDWTQRLPGDIRKYKDQILAKLHIAHHEHKRNERMSHRLKIVERFQWFLFWFIFAYFAPNNKVPSIFYRHHTLHKLKKSFSTLISLSYLLCVCLVSIVVNVIGIVMRFFGGAFYFLFGLMVSLGFFFFVFLLKWRKQSMGQIFELIFEL